MGFAVLTLADAVLALAPNLLVTLLGISIWGLHMGMTQGLLASMVAGTATSNRRGTAFGIFNLVGGVALLAASILAGSLWQAFGSGAAFLGGATLTTIGLAAAVTLLPRVRPPTGTAISSISRPTGH